MKTKFARVAGFLGVVAALGLIYITDSKAQPAGNRPNASSVTTNWVGCLVVGKEDAVDAMARGLHPTTVQQVEIGLRSDGVVIWRDATK